MTGTRQTKCGHKGGEEHSKGFAAKWVLSFRRQRQAGSWPSTVAFGCLKSDKCRNVLFVSVLQAQLLLPLFLLLLPPFYYISFRSIPLSIVFNYQALVPLLLLLLSSGLLLFCSAPVLSLILTRFIALIKDAAAWCSNNCLRSVR